MTDFTFWVIVAFRNRAELLLRCLESIDAQCDPGFSVLIGDDASDESRASGVGLDWGSYLPVRERQRWRYVRRAERFGTLRNQVDLIRSVGMDPDDVIVFVDGDDRLAHPCALSILREAYSDGTLLTYGSYDTDPPSDTCSPAEPYPPNILRSRQFRRAGHRFNHLRTMRRCVFDAITDDDLMVDGRWPMAGGDYAMMMPALELAAPRIKVIRSVLYTYTSDREDSDWRVNAAELNTVHRAIARKPRKAPLRVR